MPSRALSEWLTLSFMMLVTAKPMAAPTWVTVYYLHQYLASRKHEKQAYVEDAASQGLLITSSSSTSQHDAYTELYRKRALVVV